MSPEDVELARQLAVAMSETNRLLREAWHRGIALEVTYLPTTRDEAASLTLMRASHVLFGPNASTESLVVELATESNPLAEDQPCP